MLIKFPNEQVELSIGITTCHYIHLDMRHPSQESHGWCRIRCILFHLRKSEVLQANNRLRENAHKHHTKIHMT